MTRRRALGSNEPFSKSYHHNIIGSISPPSQRLPSTCHSYKGDVRIQDLFVECIESHRKRKDNHRILFPGTDRFNMERMDMVSSLFTTCLIQFISHFFVK